MAHKLQILQFTNEIQVRLNAKAAEQELLVCMVDEKTVVPAKKKKGGFFSGVSKFLTSKTSSSEPVSPQPLTPDTDDLSPEKLEGHIQDEDEIFNQGFHGVCNEADEQCASDLRNSQKIDTRSYNRRSGNRASGNLGNRGSGNDNRASWSTTAPIQRKDQQPMDTKKGWNPLSFFFPRTQQVATAEAAPNQQIYEKAMGLTDTGNSFYQYFSQAITQDQHTAWLNTYIPMIEQASSVTWWNNQGMPGIATDKHTKELVSKEFLKEVDKNGIPVFFRG